MQLLLKLESSQDIGFGYYTDSADLQITVDWPEEAVIEITKKDGDTGKNLAGAVYGVYSDNACTKLIVKMPPTDSNGSSTSNSYQDTGYCLLKRDYSTGRLCCPGFLLWSEISSWQYDQTRL